MINSRRLSLLLSAGLALLWCPRLKAQVDRPPGLLSDLVDISADFHQYRNTYFLADKLTGFDPAAGAGAGAEGLVCLPADNLLRRVEAARRNGAFTFASDPLAGKATSTVRMDCESTK